MKNTLAVNLALGLVAAIWVFGFVPQRESMDYFTPTAFNGIRFALGVLTLIPFICFSRKVALADIANRGTLLAGLALGFTRFAGATFQQIAIQLTSLAQLPEKTMEQWTAKICRLV